MIPVRVTPWMKYFWAKKKMTLADTETVKGNAEVTKHLETTSKIIPASEAKTMLDRAEAFAHSRDGDPLLVAIRFFEIADRFPDAPEGKKAMQQSLAAMQKIVAKAKQPHSIVNIPIVADAVPSPVPGLEKAQTEYNDALRKYKAKVASLEEITGQYEQLKKTIKNYEFRLASLEKQGQTVSRE